MLQTFGYLFTLNGTKQPSQARSSFHSSFNFPFRRKDSRWMQHFFAEPVSSSMLGRPGEKDLLGRLKGMERKVTPVSPYVSSQLVTGPWFHQPVCPGQLIDTLGFSLEYVQVTCPYFVCSMSSIPFILPHSPPPLPLPCLLERHKLDAALSLLCCGNELCAPEFGYWLWKSKGFCSDTEVWLSPFWYY